eukprot:Selendium_serpulae@DN5018_c0_g2_i2.p3
MSTLRQRPSAVAVDSRPSDPLPIASVWAANSRGQKCAVALSAALGLHLITGWSAVTWGSPGWTAQQLVWLTLPLVAVLLFGVYSAALIAIKVAQFQDVPHEIELLNKDIAMAEAELLKRGFRQDDD